MTVPRGDAVALARELIRIDSRNPSLDSGGPGEDGVAEFLAQVLREWQLDVRVIEARPGRKSVVARRRGTGGGRSLMFNGHLDVVGIEGMTHTPFDAVEKQGRIYGRGSSDMKGGVAAMCAAAARLPALRGDVIIAAVCDEEWQSLGTASVIGEGFRADAAIVTEPTGLAIMPAHKGFVWIEFRVAGRAAHGSRWDLGVDAIRGAAFLLETLDAIERELAATSHPLLGRPSLHASLVEGGTGMSTYPERCVLRVERRTLPGESVEKVRSECARAVADALSRQPGMIVEFDLLLAQPPSDVPTTAPLVQELSSVLEARGKTSGCLGMSAWTDAALLNDAGIPAICFGPGDMGLAHAAEEYIEIRQIDEATDVLVAFAQRWCGIAP